MPLETFDYGNDHESPGNDRPISELDDLFGTSAGEPRRRPARDPLGNLDMRVAIQVVVAIILVVVAGALLARDAWARQARDNAFRQMNEANSRHEYARVVEAAERFLTSQPFNRTKDDREPNVVSLYSEALVHWVAQQPGPLDDKTRAHVTRYKQLVNDPGH